MAENVRWSERLRAEIALSFHETRLFHRTLHDAVRGTKTLHRHHHGGEVGLRHIKARSACCNYFLRRLRTYAVAVTSVPAKPSAEAAKKYTTIPHTFPSFIWNMHLWALHKVCLHSITQEDVEVHTSDQRPESESLGDEGTGNLRKSASSPLDVPPILTTCCRAMLLSPMWNHRPSHKHKHWASHSIPSNQITKAPLSIVFRKREDTAISR